MVCHLCQPSSCRPRPCPCCAFVLANVRNSPRLRTERAGRVATLATGALLMLTGPSALHGFGFTVGAFRNLLLGGWVSAFGAALVLLDAPAPAKHAWLRRHVRILTLPAGRQASPDQPGQNVLSTLTLNAYALFFQLPSFSCPVAALRPPSRGLTSRSDWRIARPSRQAFSLCAATLALSIGPSGFVAAAVTFANMFYTHWRSTQAPQRRHARPRRAQPPLLDLKVKDTGLDDDRVARQPSAMAGTGSNRQEACCW